MPTPKSLASDVSAAEIAAAANAARARHNADVAEKGGSEADQPPPGEGWSASSWLREQRVSDIVGRVLMRPLADLETGAAFAGASVYPGSVELHFCRALGAKGSRMALLRLLREGDVIETLVDALWPKLEALASTGAATATELHNKFVDEGAGFDLEYAGLKSFFSGLEAVVGAPTPQVYMGMKRDHCDCEDSVIPFDTPNYKMTTTSRIEWYFVADPELGMKELRLDSYPAEHPDTIHGSAQPRQWLKLASFDEARREKNRELNDLASSQDAGMMIEEFIGARLYTGPCFVKYNTTLRGLQSSIAFFKRRFESLCKGNRYTTTLHVINSAIVKLSKLTQATYVYRGVAGGRLPKHFRVANEYGVRGGIDPAFMSTTLDRQVALTYASSSSGPGVVFSMRQGMVDRGADIGWLSQYPHEKEILFAPLTGLEIHSISVDGTVLVPEIRLSVNLNSQTIEQVIQRRRKLLTDMGKNMAVEVSAGLAGTGFEGTSVKMLDQDLAENALAEPVMWYNDEDNFKLGVTRVIEAKRAALDHEKRLRWLLAQPDELAEHADSIVKLLRFDDPAVRRAALEALEALPPEKISPHGSALVPMLRDDKEEVREAAVRAIGKLEAAALSHLAPTMLLQLDHATQHPHVRRANVLALGHLEPLKLAQYAHAICTRLTDQYPFVRKAVLEVMGRLDQGALLPHATLMMMRLEDESKEVRDAAVATLGRVAASLGLNAIVARTAHPECGVRHSAVTLLGKLEPAMLNERIHVIVARTDDDKDHVRGEALRVLQSLPPQELAKHIDTVARRLEDPSAAVRHAAVDTIAKLERHVLLVYMPAVVRCLEDADPTVRQKAVSTLLSRLEVTELVQHVHAIVGLIEDSDDGVRRAAAMWATAKLDAGLLGRHVAQIAICAGDPIVSVRRAALEAIARIEPALLVPHAKQIVARLEDTILSVRKAAIEAIARLAPADLAPHAPALLQRLRDPEWVVRTAAVETLGRLESSELRVVAPTLLLMLEDVFDSVRTAAVDVLLEANARPAATPLLLEHAPAIAQRLEHTKAPVREAALSLLAELPAPAVCEYLAPIVRLVGDASRLVRHASLIVLAQLPEAELVPHVQSIARCVEDDDDDVRAAALEALRVADPSGQLIALSPNLLSPPRLKSMRSSAHGNVHRDSPSPARLMGSHSKLHAAHGGKRASSVRVDLSSSFPGLDAPPDAAAPPSNRPPAPLRQQTSVLGDLSFTPAVDAPAAAAVGPPAVAAGPRAGAAPVRLA